MKQTHTHTDTHRHTQTHTDTHRHTHTHTRIFLVSESLFAVSESLNIDDFPVTQVAPMGSESFLPEIQATASLEPPKSES